MSAGIPGAGIRASTAPMFDIAPHRSRELLHLVEGSRSRLDAGTLLSPSRDRSLQLQGAQVHAPRAVDERDAPEVVSERVQAALRVVDPGFQGVRSRDHRS